MIKNIFLIALITIVLKPISIQSQPVTDLLLTVPQNQLKLEGHVGDQTNLLIKNRVLAQDYDELVEPFRHKNETHLWQMEFWGKWMHWRNDFLFEHSFKYKTLPRSEGIVN